MATCTLSRLITSKKVDNRSKYELFDAFLSDKGRLIYSAPFRRLQQKAQVFSLESNSAVRSRLSHSLEVAHIGAYISHAITKKIKQNENKNEDMKFWIDNEISINTVVETTCLMHDIGNPPFGHFGESTISEWFQNDVRLSNIIAKAGLTNGKENICDCVKDKLSIKDFILFDGNPQALRIATKLQGEDGLTGLNFTFTQIAASLKYTHGGKNYSKNKSNHLTSKLGYFSTEQEIVEKVWDELGMPENGRHPLTFIMEAADDISYCTSDIDDGIENKVVTEKDFFEYITTHTPPSILKNQDIFDIVQICKGIRTNHKISAFTEFKTKLSSKLVEKAASIFSENFCLIMQFGFHSPLLKEDLESEDILFLLCLVKKFTREHIFNNSDVELIELSGHSILTGLLNCYTPILELKADEFLKLINDEKSNASKVAARLSRTLPKKCVKSYKEQLEIKKHEKFTEWNLRAHLIIDFISGMTDQYALELYQSLAGIKVK
ncbi:dGTPase [Pantoea sp. RRHST58]|uniref:dGTPase n=1 Tax=Pantoea sp. RRHST58 TaxID=3425183 RepID=UPI003DA10F72